MSMSEDFKILRLLIIAIAFTAVSITAAINLNSYFVSVEAIKAGLVQDTVKGSTNVYWVQPEIENET